MRIFLDTNEIVPGDAPLFFSEPLFEAENFPPSGRMFQIRQIPAHSSTAATGNFYRCGNRSAPSPLGLGGLHVAILGAHKRRLQRITDRSPSDLRRNLLLLAHARRRPHLHQPGGPRSSPRFPRCSHVAAGLIPGQPPALECGECRKQCGARRGRDRATFRYVFVPLAVGRLLLSPLQGVHHERQPLEVVLQSRT